MDQASNSLTPWLLGMQADSKLTAGPMDQELLASARYAWSVWAGKATPIVLLAFYILTGNLNFCRKLLNALIRPCCLTVARMYECAWTAASALSFSRAEI
jgi:hypothetical protein